jgi:hypothetical protein
MKIGKSIEKSKLFLHAEIPLFSYFAKATAPWYFRKAMVFFYFRYFFQAGAVCMKQPLLIFGMAQ